ncbi:MAG: outer membrane lipoprotein chaperone LolA, partial [Xanthomonadales bacterium]|nr:outer membrane lipoprotein chaperone LolA [Xanthomonadales bacterium]
MQMFPLLLAAALALLAGAQPALAVDPRIEELTGSLETLTGRFEQQVVDETGRLVEESTGALALSEPNLFRWHYETPYEQLIVADGNRVWMHDVELEQVTVKDQDTAASSSPLYVLTRPATLEERYEVSYSKQDGVELILLRPRAPEAEFEWVEIAFVDSVLEGLVIQDGFGQQTRIRL